MPKNKAGFEMFSDSRGFVRESAPFADHVANYANRAREAGEQAAAFAIYNKAQGLAPQVEKPGPAALTHWESKEPDMRYWRSRGEKEADKEKAIWEAAKTPCIAAYCDGFQRVTAENDLLTRRGVEIKLVRRQHRFSPLAQQRRGIAEPRVLTLAGNAHELRGSLFRPLGDFKAINIQVRLCDGGHVF